MMMSRREMFSGAPITRGFLSAIIFPSLGCFMLGDMDIGAVWVFVDDKPTTHIHWGIDIVLLLGGLAAWGWGLINLCRAVRNGWFAWAKDDTEWNGIRRSEVNREPPKFVQALYRRLGG